MKNPVRFRMILRDRQVEVLAEIIEFVPQRGRASFSIAIYDLQGQELSWELEQWEIANVAREAGKASGL